MRLGYDSFRPISIQHHQRLYVKQRHRSNVPPVRDDGSESDASEEGTAQHLEPYAGTLHAPREQPNESTVFTRGGVISLSSRLSLSLCLSLLLRLSSLSHSHSLSLSLSLSLSYPLSLCLSLSSVSLSQSLLISLGLSWSFLFSLSCPQPQPQPQPQPPKNSRKLTQTTHERNQAELPMRLGVDSRESGRSRTQSLARHKATLAKTPMDRKKVQREVACQRR